MQTTPPEMGSLWQAMQEIAPTLTLMAAAWTARMVFVMRDELRTLKQEWSGADGKNGAKSVLADHTRQLEAINLRHVAIDAVHAAEQDLHEGEERRRHSRRLMDRVKDSLVEGPHNERTA